MNKEITIKRINTRTLLNPPMLGCFAILYPLLLLGALNGNMTQGDITVEGLNIIWAPFVISITFAITFSAVGCLFLEVGFRLRSLFGPITIKYNDSNDG